MADVHHALLGIFALEALLNQLPAQVDNILRSLQTVTQQVSFSPEGQPVLFR